MRMWAGKGKDVGGEGKGKGNWEEKGVVCGMGDVDRIGWCKGGIIYEFRWLVVLRRRGW